MLLKTQRETLVMDIWTQTTPRYLRWSIKELPLLLLLVQGVDYFMVMPTRQSKSKAIRYSKIVGKRK